MLTILVVRLNVCCVDMCIKTFKLLTLFMRAGWISVRGRRRDRPHVSLRAAISFRKFGNRQLPRREVDSPPAAPNLTAFSHTACCSYLEISQP